MIEHALSVNESPYLHPGDMSSSTYDIRGDHSVDTLVRDYKYLFSLTEEEWTIDFLINVWNTALIGVVSPWRNSTSRVLPVFKLRFVEQLHINVIPSEVRDKILLQTDRVVLKKDLRNYGIAYQVYRRLANRGYALISDRTHFEPARGLWMKLARNSDAAHRVILCDTDHGAIRDDAGNTLCYNGSNYPQQFVWTQGSDFTGYNLVLIHY